MYPLKVVDKREVAVLSQAFSQVPKPGIFKMEFEQSQRVLLFQNFQNPNCQTATALKLAETRSIHRMTRTLNPVRTEF